MTTPLTVSVNPGLHKHIVHLMNTGQTETGGTLELNTHRQSLDIAEWRHGKAYDTVSIPPGLLQFHTHLKNCSATRCTLGIPSAGDLKSFALAAANKHTMGHLVYSDEGVYSILMQPRFLKALRHDKRFADKFAKLSESNFNAITQNFIKHRTNYRTFQQHWMKAANAAGFKIRLTPLQIPPAFLLHESLVTDLRDKRGAILRRS